MKHQPHRLPADDRHFAGAEIDRDRPLSFRLNGRTYEAFAGDTVLSALLAAGVDAAGMHHGETISIDERFAPPVALAKSASDPASAMPMDRTPVAAGLDLITLGPRPEAVRLSGVAARVASLVTPRSRSLGHRLDDPRAFEGAWLQLPPVRAIEAHTVVVGGGLAGMTAALAAAKAGEKVVLIERRPVLGGDARFFGTAGDEDSPDAIIARLVERIENTSDITVLTLTDAFGLTGTRVRAHQVEVTGGKAEGGVLDVTAQRVILATGTAERLPVFPGNRMPRVVGAVAAFHRAERYGIWAGRRALFATPHNYTYRLALLASDAGVEVQRVFDTRLGPQSRFIDFCKASGITISSGLAPRFAETPRKTPKMLSVGFAMAVEDTGQDAAPMLTDLLVAAGGWQPRLALWLMAGGRCGYDPERHWLGAEGTVEGVTLVGSAAGYRSSAAVMRSGEQVIGKMLGQLVTPIEDSQVDAVYESRDTATSIAAWRAGRTAGFLDAGLSFTPRPHPPRKDAAQTLPAQLLALSVGDVAASVELGAIPVAEAGIIAQERCLGGGDLSDSGWRVPAPPAHATTEVPAYLAGRFGPKPLLIVIAATDSRAFEIGCLIYPSSDAADPLAAIGVVIGPAPDNKPGGLAVGNRAALGAAATLFVRDSSGAVAAKIVEKLKPPVAEKPA